MTIKETKNQFTQLIKPWLKLFPLDKSAEHLVVRRNFPALKVVLFSAHPDDECLIGGLAFRLQSENKAKVTNIAYSLGSNLEHRPRRAQELKKATTYLKIKNYILPKEDKLKKKALNKLLKEINPDLIITHHSQDFHVTHIKAHRLLISSLKEISWEGKIALADFWQELSAPNILIEYNSAMVKKIYEGLTFHKGEIERNPYHWRLIAWLVNNVRRGSEVVNKSGEKSPNFIFGQNYQLVQFNNKKIRRYSPPFSNASALHDLSDLIYR